MLLPHSFSALTGEGLKDVFSFPVPPQEPCHGITVNMLPTGFRLNGPAVVFAEDDSCVLYSVLFASVLVFFIVVPWFWCACQ